MTEDELKADIENIIIPAADEIMEFNNNDEMTSLTKIALAISLNTYTGLILLGANDVNGSIKALCEARRAIDQLMNNLVKANLNMN